ncbi:MAG: anthranilate phosphoribosyltransferase [Gemmataceae bacterium]|nr:anthranilate phosphoribosyltransferase [Gemmataceae bacterium]MDW8266358.1 anthranilate phosphoribosyltransferase [Gemmataceae bacterium]
MHGLTLVDVTAPSWYPSALHELFARRDLSPEQVRTVLTDLLAGRCGDVEAAALLVAWRCKGESAEEIAAAVSVLRQHMIQLETGRDDLLDTAGTGGDGTGTFNISTAAALTAAAAGVPVVKHGNRAVSSHSGSADALQELGVSLVEGTAWPLRCLREAGVAFCFAPYFHPLLRRLGPLRQRLGVRTVLNCLGPLANPAGAACQLVGVGFPQLLDPLAGALARLGTRHAFVVHGSDGLDEVTLSGTTWVREVRGGRVMAHEWTPADFGLESCHLEDLRAVDPRQSAAIIREVLDGVAGPAQRVVLANTAAALLAADHVTTLAEGVARAREALGTGRARAVLGRLVALASG